jgi:hypothetical protein
MQAITEQTSSEHFYLLCSEEDDRDVCYYILAPKDEMYIIKKYEKGENVSIQNCYRIHKYRDEKEKIRIVHRLLDDNHPRIYPHRLIIDMVSYFDPRRKSSLLTYMYIFE